MRLCISSIVRYLNLSVTNKKELLFTLQGHVAPYCIVLRMSLHIAIYIIVPSATSTGAAHTNRHSAQAKESVHAIVDECASW